MEVLGCSPGPQSTETPRWTGSGCTPIPQLCGQARGTMHSCRSGWVGALSLREPPASASRSRALPWGTRPCRLPARGPGLRSIPRPPLHCPPPWPVPVPIAPPISHRSDMAARHLGPWSALSPTPRPRTGGRGSKARPGSPGHAQMLQGLSLFAQEIGNRLPGGREDLACIWPPSLFKKKSISNFTETAIAPAAVNPRIHGAEGSAMARPGGLGPTPMVHLPDTPNPSGHTGTSIHTEQGAAHSSQQHREAETGGSLLRVGVQGRVQLGLGDQRDAAQFLGAGSRTRGGHGATRCPGSPRSVMGNPGTPWLHGFWGRCHGGPGPQGRRPR